MKPQYKQNGATLVTALVMLVVLTLLVISAIKSSTVNLRIAGNMQLQEEAVAGAQQATEQILSMNFPASPVASSIAIDINNDGVTDYTASIAVPTCTGSRALLNNEPQLPSACVSGSTAQNTGINYVSAVANTAPSWCYAQRWDVQTSVTDSVTGATTTMHQGVSMNVPAGTGC